MMVAVSWRLAMATCVCMGLLLVSIVAAGDVDEGLQATPEHYKHYGSDRPWLRTDYGDGPTCTCPPGGAGKAKICLGTSPGNSFPIGAQNFPTTTVFDGRYRLDTSGGWDSAIAPAGSPVAGLDVDISNDPSVFNGQPFDFTASYTPGKGYVWTLRGPSGSATPGPFVVYWTLSSTPGGLLNNVRPIDYFNSIVLRVSSSAAGQSMTVTNLAFTAPGMDVCGSLRDLSVSGANSAVQFLVANADLSQQAWVLTGTATGVKPSGGQEAVKLDVYTVPWTAQSFTDCNGNACPAARSTG